MLFSITNNFAQKIKIMNPNGNESFTASTYQYIYLEKDTLKNYNISFSKNNGKEWLSISKNYLANNNYFNYSVLSWQVPNIYSDSCLLKISNSLDTSNYDISDKMFSIVEGAVKKEFNFPLQIGNAWFFVYEGDLYNVPNPKILTIVKVSKDTLMDDENRYAVIDRFDSSTYNNKWDKYEGIYKLLRVEGSKVYEYPNILLFDCNWTEQGQSTGNWSPFVIDYVPLFEQFYLTYYLKTFSEEWTSYMDGIGFYELYILHWNDYSRSSRTLVGCLLNGKSYGKIITDIKNGNAELPNKYDLYQNYPNPFNPTTTISYTLPEAGAVKIKIYDILGREVAKLVDEQKNAGKHSVVWNGNDDSGKMVASGNYFYQIICGDFIQTKKMILLK